jgi:hypothetical protein
METIEIASWDVEQPNSNLMRQYTILVRSAASASKLATSD